MTKYLNVLGKKYKLVFTELEDDILGLCIESPRPEIHIESRQTQSEIDHSLIHELIHATFHRIGLQSTKIDEDVIEIICDTIGAVINENFILKLR